MLEFLWYAHGFHAKNEKYIPESKVISLFGKEINNFLKSKKAGKYAVFFYQDRKHFGINDKLLDSEIEITELKANRQNNEKMSKSHGLTNWIIALAVTIQAILKIMEVYKEDIGLEGINYILYISLLLFAAFLLGNLIPLIVKKQ